MQATICAKVDSRLLTKASRLFTGSTEGRIIEILQNARRAGATEVRISNKDGFVIGSYEQLRHELVSQINLNYGLHDKWQKAVVTEDGSVTIHFKDGHLETVKRPTKD